MSTLKVIAMVIAISVLYYGLMLLGAGFTGAGHGSDFFLSALFAPFSAWEAIAPIGLLLWPGLALLVAMRRFPACRLSAMAVLGIHYLGVLMVSYQTDWSYVRKVCYSMPVTVAAFLLVYFASQVFMWIRIVRKQNAG